MFCFSVCSPFEDSEPEPEPPRTQSYGTSRLPYSRKEKEKILKFIISVKGYSRLRGNKFWQEMAQKTKSPRPWQSLKEHFRKQIYPALGSFFAEGLPRTELSKIKRGYDGDYVSSPEEDSSDGDISFKEPEQNGSATKEKEPEGSRAEKKSSSSQHQHQHQSGFLSPPATTSTPNVPSPKSGSIYMVTSSSETPDENAVTDTEALNRSITPTRRKRKLFSQKEAPNEEFEATDTEIQVHHKYGRSCFLKMIFLHYYTSLFQTLTIWTLHCVGPIECTSLFSHRTSHNPHQAAAAPHSLLPNTSPKTSPRISRTSVNHCCFSKIQ